MPIQIHYDSFAGGPKVNTVLEELNEIRGEK